jgi:hypothetical protein
MKTKEELKAEYLAKHTVGWDKETKEEFNCYVEEDFEIWYQGYEYALKEFKHE